MFLSVWRCQVRNQTHASMEEFTGQRLVKKISVIGVSKPTSIVIAQDIYGRTDKITVSYLI